MSNGGLLIAAALLAVAGTVLVRRRKPAADRRFVEGKQELPRASMVAPTHGPLAQEETSAF